MPSQGWMQTLITAQVAGTALTAAAAASALPAQAKYTLPANYFSTIGQAITIKAAGKISSVITTPGTARFDVRFGATVVFDGLAVLLDTVAAHTNVGWTLEINLTAQIVGTSAQLMGHGIFNCEAILGTAATMPKADGNAILPWNSVPVLGTAFDATASQVMDFFFTQTVATGSMTVQQYRVISEN